LSADGLADLTCVGTAAYNGFYGDGIVNAQAAIGGYYTRLERCDINLDLARAAQPTTSPPRRRRSNQRIRPVVQHIVDAMTGAAAFVRSDRLDILAGTSSGTPSTRRCSSARPAGEHRPLRLPRRARP